MRRYALVLLLVAACAQETTQDPYERAAACEDIVGDAEGCRMYIVITGGELREMVKAARGKKLTAEQLAKYAELKEQMEAEGDCNRVKVRECELFLADFAIRVK